MMMMKRRKSKAVSKFIAAVLAVGLLFSCCPSATLAQTEGADTDSLFDVGSRGMVCMEGQSGKIMYDKNGDEQFYPASLTKVLTALVVLENTKDLKKVTTVSENAVDGIDPSSSHIALDIGEKISVEDLLYGLLLASGNDCAVALAEETSGSVKEFAKLMNKKVKDLGLKNSHFVNPHGLFDKKHYTTPKDLARIMKSCIRNKKFVEIMSTLKNVVPKTNKSEKRELWNNHRMVKGKYQYYKGVVGGKTGYITESRFNLITYAKKGDMDLVTVGMRCDGQSEIVDDTKKVLDYYFDKYHVDVLKKKDIGEKRVVIDDKKIKVKATKDIRMILPKDKTAKDVKSEASPYEEMELPVKKGQIVGKVTANLDGKQVGATTVVSKQNVMSKMQIALRVGAAIFVAVMLILLLVVMIIRSKKRKKKQIFTNK